MMQWMIGILWRALCQVFRALPDEEHLPDLNAWLVGQGVPVYAMAPQQLSLEQLFVQIMDGEQREGDAA